jgi:sugar phosphate isomerase/epimerase
VADWFAPSPVGPRPDRALPGAGVSRTRELLALLVEAGWDSWLDVEIFGDPANPESFWSLPVERAARQAYEAAVGVLP